MTKRGKEEAAVVRAAMRWYNNWKRMPSAEECGRANVIALDKACARLAKQRKGAKK